MCASLADGLTTGAASGYQGSVTSTKLKVSGIDVFSAGDFSGGEGAEDIVLRDATRGIYKRVVVKDDRLVGAVLYGDTADGNRSEEHTSELQSLMRISYAVFCSKKKNKVDTHKQ